MMIFLSYSQVDKQCDYRLLTFVLVLC